MIHLPLFWVLDVTKMCDKRNIDHAISRHNPEAKKLYWLTTVVILSKSTYMLSLINVKLGNSLILYLPIFNIVIYDTHQKKTHQTFMQSHS